MIRPRRSLLQIANMSIGFLGIQFAFGLQLSNMSAIFEMLGASADRLPGLWLAAPLSGLLVQPIIGNMSDRTWNRLGRRRPYFLAGAILSSLALLWMPSSTTVWMAALGLWVLDASINITMEPFRAFVADLLPEGQRTLGFAIQSIFIGLGAVVASALPWMLTHVFHLSAVTAPGTIAAPVRVSFYIGAAAFFGAVLWTIVTTPEMPPENMDEFRAAQREHGLSHVVQEVVQAWRTMPDNMLRIGIVQLLSYLGLFCMWLYFGVAVAHNVFHADDPSSATYREGIEWGGVCSAAYNAVCFLFSFSFPALVRRFGRKYTHTFCLLCGAAGLLSTQFIHSRYGLLGSMVGVGIAWAGVLSMPYAMLAAILPPHRMGVYMGIFNFFVVIPEILSALVFGSIVRVFLHNDRMLAVGAGGVAMLLAAIMLQRVRDPQTLTLQDI